MSALKAVLASLGVVNGLLYLLSRSIDVLTGGRCRLVKYYFLAQPVPARPLVPDQAGSGTVARVGPDHPIVAQFPRPPEVIDLRFRTGAICFSAEKAGQFIGFLWLKHEWYDEDEVRCVFVPRPSGRAVWDFDLYVAPRFRLGRAFARLWDEAFDYLRREGINWTVSRISAFNRASLQSHQRLGAVRVGVAAFIACGRLQVAFLDRRPYVHLSLAAGSRPRIEVHTPAD